MEREAALQVASSSRHSGARVTRTPVIARVDNAGQSHAVRDVQNSDFMARYAEGHPNEGDQVNRYYQGTRFIDEIERAAKREIMDLFRCRQADGIGRLRPGLGAERAHLESRQPHHQL